jgi:hypothetical protein
MSIEAYAVAVKVSLINHVTPGLLSISKGLNHAGMDADKLNSKLMSIGKQAAIGAGLFAGGLAIARVFKAPLDEAKKYQTEMAKFSLFGMSDQVNAESDRFVKSMNSMGASITTNLKLFTEAQGVFRESGIGGMQALDGAKIAAPILAKIAYATSGLSEESQAKMKTGSMAMLRYIEDSGGLKSPKRFGELADAGWRMTQTSGGSVDWEQLRQFKARGGVAAMGMSDNAMAMYEPIITMLKGQTAGFSLRTAYNRLNGIIKIPNQVAHELVKNNVWDGSKVIWNAQGGIKAFKGNPLKQADLFSSNSIEFYEKVIMPMHKKMGITSDSAIGQSNAMLFGSTGGAMFTLIDKNMEKLHMSLQAQNSALGIDASVEKTHQTLGGKEVEFGAKWKDLMLNLGIAILPMVCDGLDKLNPKLKELGIWIGENPDKVNRLTDALIGLSAVLITGGLVNAVIAAGRGLYLLGGALVFLSGTALGPLLPMVARFATYIVIFGANIVKVIGLIGRAMLMNPIGLVITGIIVIGLLLWNNWKEISGALKVMWNDMKEGFTKLFHGDFAGAFTSFKHLFLLGWQTIFNTLIAGFNTIMPASLKMEKMHFADAPASNPLVAPVPKKDWSRDPFIVHMHVDGKKMAEVVVDRMAKQAARPNTGTNSFDPSRSMLMPGTPSAVYPRG